MTPLFSETFSEDSAIIDAREFSQVRIASIRTLIEGSMHYERVQALGLGFIVTGSLGRLEALEASDIDLTTLCPDDAPRAEVNEVDQTLRSLLRRELGAEVSKGENFTGPTYIEDLAHRRRIGGGEDNVNLLTKRMLLLTESRSVTHPVIRDQFRQAIFDAFFSSSATKRSYLISLVDDLVRHYRTLCVDFKSRVDWENKPWAPRYLKLRHSRKYWFFSVMLGITAAVVRHETRPEIAEENAAKILDLTPTERIRYSLELAGISGQTAALAFYDIFLQQMRKPEVRGVLDDVVYADRHSSQVFLALKRNADRMHRAMLETIDTLPTNWRRHLLSRFLLHS
jgi:hypothetical protein